MYFHKLTLLGFSSQKTFKIKFNLIELWKYVELVHKCCLQHLFMEKRKMKIERGWEEEGTQKKEKFNRGMYGNEVELFAAEVPPHDGRRATSSTVPWTLKSGI